MGPILGRRWADMVSILGARSYVNIQLLSRRPRPARQVPPLPVGLAVLL